MELLLLDDGAVELLVSLADGVELLLGEGEVELLLDDGEALLELEGADDVVSLLCDDIPVALPCDDEPMPPLELCEAPPCNAASVCESSWPDGVRLFCCWNCLRALFVFGPSWPSTGPGSIPLSFSACCASRTSELLPCMDDEDPYPPEALEALPLIADDPCSFCDREDDFCCSLYCASAAEGVALLEACADLSEDLLSFANAAVLETARAAMTRWDSFIL